MQRIIGLTIVGFLFAISLSAQVHFKLELLSDNETYRMSMVSDVTWVFPQNLTASAQTTIRVPHAPTPFGFVVGDLVNIQPGTEWDDNVRVYAPAEAPEWDYISFSLISGATGAFNYVAGVEIPLFEFNNAAESCVGKLELINNDTDPFLPPNSVGANIAHSITVIGGGLMNAYWGNIGDAEVPCLPFPACTVNGADIEIAICQDELFNGVLFENDTVLVEHLLSSVGCDSTVETLISVLQPSITDIEMTLCKGGKYEGVSIWQDSTVVLVYQGFQGCDSSVIAHLDVVEYYSSSQNKQLCEGSIYAGIPVYTDTLIIEYLTASSGCDSIVNTSIDIVEQLETVIDTVVCVGDSLYGTPIFSDTSIVFLLQSFVGCDSIVQVNIMANPLPIPVIDLQQNNCENALVTGNYANYLWNTNEMVNEITIYQAGQYSLTVTDENGCVGYAAFDYVGATNVSAELNIEQPNCNKNSHGKIEFLNANGGSGQYLFSINGGNDFYSSPIFNGLVAGNYLAVVEDDNGCNWSQEVQIEPHLELFLVSDYQQLISLGENANLEIFTNLPLDSVAWQPAVADSCPKCTEISVSPMETTNYQVTVFASNGCTDSIDAWVLVAETPQVFVPNSFSPNGDGINDYFMPLIGPSVREIRSFKVFERQGGMVYKAENILTNDSRMGWDGKWRGYQAADGVYVYMAEIELISGEMKLISGEIIIMK